MFAVIFVRLMQSISVPAIWWTSAY